jgi:hypothetical protein
MILTTIPAPDASSRAGTSEPPVTTAGELARRIQVPRRLPPRYDGEPMRHLSNSSYTRFLACPEDWRRHHILGQRTAPTGAMVLGGCVDEAIGAYYQQLLDGVALTRDQVHDAYREMWAQRLADEQDKLGIAWEQDLDQRSAFHMGLEAIELTFSELVPHLGRPVAVQRKLEFALAQGLEWSILCYLDLETVRDDERGQALPAIVDYKVKNSPVTQAKADRDPQASLYLAGRWLEGQPAHDFQFAQVAKPGKKRKSMNSSLVTTARSTGQLRASLARVAQAASQIAACYERFGPDQPWGFADPTSWKCSPRYCAHFENACPGGAGL